MNYPYLRLADDPESPKEKFLIILIALVLFAMFLSFFPPKARAEMVNLRIIAQIESSNNPLAYNHSSQAVGLYQITPICLNDYNLTHKICYELTDLLSPKFNRLVAEWYLNKRIPQMLKAHRLPINLNTILWAYNAGVGRVKKGILPEETKNYIKKYAKLNKEVCHLPIR